MLWTNAAENRYNLCYMHMMKSTKNCKQTELNASSRFCQTQYFVIAIDHSCFCVSCTGTQTYRIAYNSSWSNSNTKIRIAQQCSIFSCRCANSEKPSDTIS